MITKLDDCEVGKSLQVTSILSESKHWIVVQLPVAYSSTNWPIRVCYLFSTISFHLNNYLLIYNLLPFYSIVQCNK